MHKQIMALQARNNDLAAQAAALAEADGDNSQAIQDIADQIDANKKTMANLEHIAQASQARAVAEDDAASAGEVEDGEEDLEGEDTKPGAGAADTKAKGKGRSWAKAVKRFAAAARRGFIRDAADPGYNREGSDADGGYTVPEDIVTRVEELKQSRASLRDLVRVVPVKAPSGRRTFQARKQQEGFVEVGEGASIPRRSGPMFSVVKYVIRKLGGWLPATNELKDDSDDDIVDTIMEWLADAGRVTDNREILAVIKKKTAVALNGLDGLKRAVLVDLDSAFRATTKIITNANGLWWLSTLKDANGRDLLTPVPSEPGKMQLSCGPVVIPVVDYPNADLPNYEGGKIPFIIGDLKEGIFLFDRKLLTIKASDVAVAGDVNAYEQDMTLFRALVRMDVQQRDSAAFINGYIEVDAAGGADAPTTLGELAVTSAAGQSSGDTSLTVSPAKAEGGVYKYKVGDAAVAVTLGQNVASWSVWDGTSDITAATGKVITLVEASADYKAVKVGTVTVTAKE